jgi:hypothetical protein
MKGINIASLSLSQRIVVLALESAKRNAAVLSESAFYKAARTHDALHDLNADRVKRRLGLVVSSVVERAIIEITTGCEPIADADGDLRPSISLEERVPTLSGKDRAFFASMLDLPSISEETADELVLQAIAAVFDEADFFVCPLGRDCLTLFNQLKARAFRLLLRAEA